MDPTTSALDWVKVFGLVTMVGTVVGSVVRLMPNAGIVANKFIPRWVWVTALVGNIATGLTKFNVAAGIEPAHAGLFVNVAGGLLGFAKMLVLPQLQAYLASEIAERIGKKISYPSRAAGPPSH